MMQRVGRLWIALFSIAILSLTGSQLKAGTFSDSMTVYDPTGKIFAQVVVTEEDEIRNGSDFIYYLNLPVGMVDPNQFGNYTIFTEANGDGSDIFGIAVGGPNGNLDLAFSSDIDGVPFPYGNSGPITLPEPGVPYDVTMYLDPSFQHDGWKAVFISDASAVPEPSTLALTLLGLPGMVYLRRRRLSNSSGN